MSLGVSQINYWRQKPETNTKNEKINIEEGGPGAQYLSYPVFLGLTILGGFFALDHLYLRSPLTFLAKIIVNILCFGLWWLYDASQAIFNSDVVKVFGLPVPGMGPKGIGAGTLTSDTPDRKHLTFLMYGLSLIFGGIFGMDSFIVGDKTSGIIRLISFVTIIFAPIAIGWWLYGLFKFFFSTRDVTDKYWEYFGAPEPKEASTSTIEWLANNIPFLSFMLGPIRTVKSVIENPEVLATGPVGKLATAAAIAAKPLINEAKTVTDPIVHAIEGAESVAESALGVVRNGVNLAGDAVTTAGKAANAISTAVGPVAELASMGIKSPIPSVDNLASAVTKRTLTGGGIESNIGILGFTLMGVISIITVSGILLTFLRSKKTNVRSERNDPPPKPGVF